MEHDRDYQYHSDHMGHNSRSHGRSYVSIIEHEIQGNVVYFTIAKLFNCFVLGPNERWRRENQKGLR